MAKRIAVGIVRHRIGLITTLAESSAVGKVTHQMLKYPIAILAEHVETFPRKASAGIR